MHCRGTHERLFLLALTLALATALAACAAPGPAPSEPPSAARPEDTGTTSAEPIGERMMPFAQRQAEMPVGMPIEIPVIAGSVVSTSAPVSDSSWLYAIETSGTVESVADWYKRAYANAGWEVGRSSAGSSSIELGLRKGGAESVLRIGEAPAGVRVDASIGVGDRAPSAF